MKHRLPMPIMLSCLCLVGSSVPAIAKERCIVLNPSQPNLFVDEFLISDKAGLQAKIRPPERLSEPIIDKFSRPDRASISADEEGRNLWPMMLYDSETGMFRMWNMIYNYHGHVAINYRESDDPFHWPGDGQVVLENLHGYATSVVDRGPSAPPNEQFLMAFYDINDPGVSLARSPDGISWRKDAEPVVPSLPLRSADPAWLEGPHDILDLFWNPLRQSWTLFYKVLSGPEFGQSRTMDEGWGIRITDQLETTDFEEWTKRGPVFRPQPTDTGITEFYGATVLPAGNLLIAFVRILRDDVAAESGDEPTGIGYTSLAFSRDGLNWRRLSEPYLDRGSNPASFDRSTAWIQSAVVVDDTVYLPYSGYSEGHKIGDRQIGMAYAERDRFIEQRSVGNKTGWLVTKPLCTEEAFSRIAVNADADQGQIHAQILDIAGHPLPGFAFSDCDPIAEDGISISLDCTGDPASIDSPFMLEFKLTNAGVFGFYLKP